MDTKHKERAQRTIMKLKRIMISRHTLQKKMKKQRKRPSLLMGQRTSMAHMHNVYPWQVTSKNVTLKYGLHNRHAALSRKGSPETLLKWTLEKSRAVRFLPVSAPWPQWKANTHTKPRMDS